MAVPKVIADFNTQISSAISIGTTSFTILSVTDDDGVAIPDGSYYFTIDAGSSNKEYLTGTLTSATKTVASVKNVSRQGLETSGAARAHRVGSAIKITDFATYKAYIDETAVAGVANATTTQQGAVELGTQAEIDAGTATGGTGASLVSTPATTRAKKYNDYIADAGSNDSYAITVVPAITAYVEGQEFTFKANTANTGACTLNVCGLGAKTIKKNATSDMATGDILEDQVVKVVYDGTNMQLQSYIPINNITTQYKHGSVSISIQDGTATNTITHGLGVVPKIIRMFAAVSKDNSSGSNTFFHSDGQYIVADATYSCLVQTGLEDGPKTASISTSYLANANTTVTVSNITSTQMDLTFTKVGSPVSSDIAVFQWQVEGQ